MKHNKLVIPKNKIPRCSFIQCNIDRLVKIKEKSMKNMHFISWLSWLQECMHVCVQSLHQMFRQYLRKCLPNFVSYQHVAGGAQRGTTGPFRNCEL